MQTQLLKVSGMTCGGCASNVTHALKAIAGVRDVMVSVRAGEAAVEYDERMTSPDQLISAVKDAGYGVELNNPRSHPLIHAANAILENHKRLR